MKINDYVLTRLGSGYMNSPLDIYICAEAVEKIIGDHPDDIILNVSLKNQKRKGWFEVSVEADGITTQLKTKFGQFTFPWEEDIKKLLGKPVNKFYARITPVVVPIE